MSRLGPGDGAAQTQKEQRMSWEASFGQSWFWVTAAILWWRSGASVFGAPRRLIAEALKHPGAADYARQLVRYRLGPGHPVPRGLLPLRWPALGALTAYCALGAVYGDMLALAVLTGLTPIALSGVWLEERMIAAVEGRSAAGAEEQSFAEALDQIWKLRFAVVLAAAAATLAASRLTADVDPAATGWDFL